MFVYPTVSKLQFYGHPCSLTFSHVYQNVVGSIPYFEIYNIYIYSERQLLEENLTYF